MQNKNTQKGISNSMIMAIVAVVVIGAGIIYVASVGTPSASVAGTTTAAPSTGTAKEGAMMGSGVALKDGRIMLEDEKGMMSPLTADYVFSDGTKVSLSGKVTKTDGTTVQLKEGESVWSGGSIEKAGAMMNGDKSTGDKNMGTTKAGVYAPYDAKLLANAATGKVILFFHATWCPTCRALDTDIRAHLNDIPSNVTILETDYDSTTALKQKYGVTTQGTFVQVDSNGNLLKKWGNNTTYTLADLLSGVK